MASRNDFSRQCREWASSLDNAILRLNFKSKRGDDEDGRRPICCDRCGASGRVRFSIRRTTEAPPNAKDAANLKVDRKRRRRKGGRRKTNDERGAKKALLGRCEVCSRVVEETLEMKARTRSSAASASTTAAPKSPLGDIQGEKGTSNVASAIEDSSGKKNKKKKKKGQRDKEEFAGLNLSKKSASPSLSSSQPLKAGDKKLLQMLRKDPAVAASSDDRLSAFLRK